MDMSNLEENDESVGLENIFTPKQQPMRYYATQSEMNNPSLRNTDLSRVVIKGNRLFVKFSNGLRIQAWRAA